MTPTSKSREPSQPGRGDVTHDSTLKERVSRRGSIAYSSPTPHISQTQSSRLLLPQTPRQWARVVGAVVGVLVALVGALAALRALSQTGCEDFNLSRDTLAVAGASITVKPADLSGSFGARLELLQQGDTSAALRRAMEALPPTIEQRSAWVVAVRTCGALPRKATLRVALPEGISARNLDLYGWFAESENWQWLGGEIDHARNELVAQVRQMPSFVVVAEPEAVPQWISVEAPENVPFAQWSAALPASAQEVVVPVAYLGDVINTLSQRHTGDMPPPRLSDGRAVIPLVRNWSERGQANTRLLREILRDPEVRARHEADLIRLLDTTGYVGVELDYRGLDETLQEPFAQFVERLGRSLSQRGKRLVIVVPAPQRALDGSWTLNGYDWEVISRVANRVKLDLTANLSAMADAEQLDSLLEWATARINRHKLVVLLPAASLQQDARNHVRPVSLEDALRPLSPVRVQPTVAQPLSSVWLQWSPEVALDGIRFGAATHIYTFTHVSEAGEPYTIWLNTAASARQVLSQLQARVLRGVAVRWLWQLGNDEGIAAVIDAYARGQLGSINLPAPSVKVAFNNGTPFSLNLDAPLLEVYAPGGEGGYTLFVFFQASRPIPIGAVPITVSVNAPPAEPPSLRNATTSPENQGDLGRLAEQFELGGHVFNLARHEARMRGTGMRWVRLYWRDGTPYPMKTMQDARARGFKVLITAVGDRTRVLDPDYRDAWAQRLAQLALAGADAIEVWSEPNYKENWPTGSINGADYTDLLKRAYQAIKQARPEVLVISAALMQTTGAYFGGCTSAGCDEIAFLSQMAAAGAPQYMDCVGVHYTVGNTPPDVVDRAHFTRYLRPLQSAILAVFNNTKPLCFTALGYVSPEGFDRLLPPEYGFALDITLAQQTQWLAEAVRMLATSGNTRLAIIWNVDSTKWVSGELGDPQAGYAMVRPDGTCPACEAIRRVMGSLP